MSTSLILLHIAASVFLLLWGTKMVKQGFTRAYGSSLRKAISDGTNNRIKAFFAGLGVTAVLQSSTATILLLTSFAKRGLITLPAALAVIIGADVSTTLVAQVLSFDLSWLAPFLLIIGIGSALNMPHGGRKKHIARAIIGLGFMLLALSLIRETSAPLKESDVLPVILGALQQDPILSILVSAILTWILHSSLTSVLLFASLATSGVIDLQLGLLLVLGANLGGTLIPFISTYKDGWAVRRITVGNIVMRIFMLALIIPFLPKVTEILSIGEFDTARQLLNFHTGFNVALAVVFLPLVSLVAMFCERIVPQSENEDTVVRPLYLDESAIDSPVIALAGAARETLRIAEMVEALFIDLLSALKARDGKALVELQKTEDDVDALYNEVKLYLTQISQESFDPKEADRYIQILTYVTNLEHAGDVIDRSLVEITKKLIEEQTRFSDEGFVEIKNFHTQVLQNMRMAQAIFISEDPKLARGLVAGKDDIRAAANETAKEHFKRLQKGKKDAIETSALHLDIIRDFRRINSYITRVAYQILENAEKYNR